MSEPRNVVVVVNYGSSALIERGLEPVQLAGVQIVVVDSYSSEGERERIRELGSTRGWELIVPPDNPGFGGGVNLGAARAFELGADVITVLNPDATIDAESLERLATAAATERIIAGATIRRPDGGLWTEGTDLYLDDGTMSGVRHRERHEGRPRAFWISGACFAVSKAVWSELGGFDEVYFLYWEDVDLSWRAAQRGIGLRIVEGVTAIHDEGGTHEDRRDGRAKSETYYYYNIRNRWVFARRNLDPATRRKWAWASRRVGWGILLQGGRRQLAASVAPWRAFVRGNVDGFRGVTDQR